MIPEDKERVIATIPKDQKKQLEDYCKKNNMNKSAAIATALAMLFYTGYKAGDLIGQMYLDKTRSKGADDERKQ